MSVEIKEVKQAIIESTTALEEYIKTMRELDWEVFDLGQEKISNLIDEGEFLIELLSSCKILSSHITAVSAKKIKHLYKNFRYP